MLFTYPGKYPEHDWALLYAPVQNLENFNVLIICFIYVKHGNYGVYVKDQLIQPPAFLIASIWRSIGK